jgi:hypothetical protein
MSVTATIDAETAEHAESIFCEFCEFWVDRRFVELRLLWLDNDR